MSGYEESDTVPLAEEGLFDGSLAGSLSTQLQAEKPSGGVPLLRWRVHRVVDNLFVRLFGVILIIVDVTLVFVRMDQLKWKFSSGADDPKGYEIVSTAIVVYFMVELCLRIFAIGPSHFFRQPWEVFDFVIITVSFIFEFAFEVGRLVVLARLVRIFLIFRLVSEQHKLKKAARLKISENKRRFRQGGFDLDLTYVTDRVIAMSFPSSGTTSIFRNPIEEVARFFNTKHADHYLIFNCCSERHYDTRFFFNRVERLKIDDHNVPPLKDIFSFCERVYQFMSESEENVIAVHCKGGKGRTGTLVCSWLLYCGKFTAAKDALDFFSDRRTDLGVSEQFQGVQTPSQMRYVGYVADIINKHNRVVPADATRRIRRIRVHALDVSPTNENGARTLSFKVFRGFEQIYDHDATERGFTHNEEMNTVDFDLRGLDVTGNIKIKFAAEGLPQKYDDCPFFFWFHTSFVAGNRLWIPREELDNPHKPKTWKYYREGFGVEVLFETDPRTRRLDPANGATSTSA